MLFTSVVSVCMRLNRHKWVDLNHQRGGRNSQ